MEKSHLFALFTGTVVNKWPDTITPTCRAAPADFSFLFSKSYALLPHRAVSNGAEYSTPLQSSPRRTASGQSKQIGSVYKIDAVKNGSLAAVGQLVTRGMSVHFSGAQAPLRCD